jgi:O-antigen ligase
MSGVLSEENKLDRTFGLERKRLLTLFGVLLAVSLGFDYSLYPGGIAHVYVHELATLIAGIAAIAIAIRTRTLLPAARATWIPLALLGLILANTVVLGAVEYHAVPVEMHKLFWFEHADAIRILVELAVWVWLFGQIDPQTDEITAIFDIALWGGVVVVVLDGFYWVLSGLIHLATTTFDLTVMFGLPLSAVFVLRRGTRGDLVRLGVFGAGSILLYSRAVLIAVAVTLALILVSARRWRAIGVVAGPVAAGWIAVLGLSLVVAVAPALSQVSRVGPPPGVTGTTISGSSALGTLLRLLSLGDTSIAGYTIPSRERIWQDALSISKKDPIFGVGYHDYFAFSKVSEVKAGSPPDTNGLFPNLIKAAHNDYLSMLVEGGVVGVLAYLAFWLLVIAASAKLWWDKADRATSAFYLGFFVSLAAVSVTGEFLIPRSPSWLAPAFVWWLLITALLIDVNRVHAWFRWPRP